MMVHVGGPAGDDLQGAQAGAAAGQSGGKATGGSGALGERRKRAGPGAQARCSKAGQGAQAGRSGGKGAAGAGALQGRGRTRTSTTEWRLRPQAPRSAWGSAAAEVTFWCGMPWALCTSEARGLGWAERQGTAGAARGISSSSAMSAASAAALSSTIHHPPTHAPSPQAPPPHLHIPSRSTFWGVAHSGVNTSSGTAPAMGRKLKMPPPPLLTSTTWGGWVGGWEGG
jgi:hypothetical protein